MRSKIVGLLAVAFSFGVVQAASAADMPTKAPMAPVAAPVYNWTGWYAGVHAGGGWGRTSVVDRDGYNTVPGDNWTYRTNGFVGGAQGGYNWQTGMIVLGAEADIGYLGATGSGPAPAGVAFFSGDTIAQTKSDFYVSLRGRLGVVAASNWLLYATGGYIGVNTRTSVVDTCFTAPCGLAVINATEQTFRSGYTVGGGVEYAVTKPWSVKFEYLYYNLGRRTVSAPAFFPPAVVPTAPWNWDTRTTGNIIRVGLNYHFN